MSVDAVSLHLPCSQVHSLSSRLPGNTHTLNNYFSFSVVLRRLCAWVCVCVCLLAKFSVKEKRKPWKVGMFGKHTHTRAFSLFSVCPYFLKDETFEQRIFFLVKLLMLIRCIGEDVRHANSIFEIKIKMRVFWLRERKKREVAVF